MTQTAHENDTDRLLREAGCVTEGHFVLINGRHTNTAVRLAPAIVEFGIASVLGRRLAGPYRDQNIDAIVGVGPFATNVALLTAFGMERLYAPKYVAGISSTGTRGVTRLDLAHRIKDQRVLLVAAELYIDLAATIRTVNRYGGVIIGLSSICNTQRFTKADLGVGDTSALEVLASLAPPSYRGLECPMCSPE